MAARRHGGDPAGTEPRRAASCAWAVESVAAGSESVDRDTTLDHVVPLGRALRPTWSRRTRRGAALRARYGADMDARSHGEQFLAFFQARLVPGVLSLLDEPEVPLSPARCDASGWASSPRPDARGRSRPLASSHVRRHPVRSTSTSFPRARHSSGG
jgi:hypothetical protein